MKICYADPPYIGQAKKHYSHDPRCAEVDHEGLIAEMDKFYDAWALSCSSTTLKQILAWCPDGVRVMSWVKPFCSFKPGVGVAYAWEPVIVKGGRKRDREQPTVRDWVSANITLKKGLSGVKPIEFSFWLFEVLNLEPSDEFTDMYPGSGAVSKAWEIYKNSLFIGVR
jgi:hypothetical protein